jgi:hypothetical protein
MGVESNKHLLHLGKEFSSCRSLPESIEQHGIAFYLTYLHAYIICIHDDLQELFNNMLCVRALDVRDKLGKTADVGDKNQRWLWSGGCRNRFFHISTR